MSKCLTFGEQQLACYPFEIRTWDTTYLVGILLLGNLFLGWVFRLFPYKGSRYGVLRDLFSVSLPLVWFGLVLTLWNGLAHYFADIVVTYVLVHIDRHVNTKRAWMPWTVFFLVMGHLVVLHVGAYFFDFASEKLDMRTPEMVSVMKLTQFAWSCYDGRREREVLRPEELTQRVEDIPGVLSYLSFVLYFPGMYTGPSFSYKVYDDFQHGRLAAQEKAYIAEKKKSKYSALAAWGLKIAVGLAELGLYLGLDPWFRTQWTHLAKRQLPLKILLTVVFGIVSRCKYYGAWTVAEAGFIASGFGFNPATQAYDLAQNVRPYPIETAQSVHDYISNWNINTTLWLRTIIYNRLTPVGRRPTAFAFYSVFIVSALWHGPHPTYMMSFVLVAVYQSVARHFRRHVRPKFLEPRGRKMLYDAAGFVYTQVTVIFYLLPFLILYYEPLLEVWDSLAYYGLYLVFVPLVCILVGLV